MVSRKRNKGKARRALKAEKERCEGGSRGREGQSAEAEVLESAAVQLKREEAAAAVAVECECSQNTVDDAKKNLFSSEDKKNLFSSEDISSHEADDAGAKMVILTRKRRGLFTSFSRYEIA